MIRIYCDSNVFRLLKPTSKQFKQEIFDYFESIRKNAVFVFSEAHLDDLRPSPEYFRNEDLEYMEKYTDDLFIQYNHSTKIWDCFRATPKMAYEERNFTAYEDALKNPFDFRSLIADLGDFPGKELVCKMVETALSAPISVHGDGEVTPEIIEQNKELLDKMVPGYHPDMSVGSFMGNIQPFLKGLFEDHKEFDELHRSATAYIDTNEFKYEKWGLAFNEQLEKTLVGKKFTDILRQLSSANEGIDYWQQFFQAYLMLELLGITEEKAGGKRKKNNMLDLTKDCAHAFNAMSCDYFITNDKGLLVKAQILYHIFQVNSTKIINLDELDSFDLAQSQVDPLNKLIPFLKLLPKSLEVDQSVITYPLKDTFLHYFDSVSKFRINDKMYMIWASKDGGHYFMYRELLKVCSLVVGIWGKDSSGKDEVGIEELAMLAKSDISRVFAYGASRCVCPTNV
ncbi:hypothetical protein ECE50_000340 [Chitinophaga sp. Mgbs1]|uniref:Uncharacterized protein n=1 Tax=Chitinophaga solisilvae TaxID=1233460 RepID=A0A9Q5D824_9BACT|nr:hypothetical protein [Chitinophaga solisilvae]